MTFYRGDKGNADAVAIGRAKEIEAKACYDRIIDLVRPYDSAAAWLAVAARDAAPGSSEVANLRRRVADLKAARPQQASDPVLILLEAVDDRLRLRLSRMPSLLAKVAAIVGATRSITVSGVDRERSHATGNANAWRFCLTLSGKPDADWISQFRIIAPHHATRLDGSCLFVECPPDALQSVVDEIQNAVRNTNQRCSDMIRSGAHGSVEANIAISKLRL